jgi:F0F1-type ATP synthase assembly protein I
MSEPTKNKEKKPINEWMRYSSLAFQLIGGIGIGLGLGHLLDRALGMNFPIFMIIFSLMTLTVLLWKIVKDTTRK